MPAGCRSARRAAVVASALVGLVVPPCLGQTATVVKPGHGNRPARTAAPAPKQPSVVAPKPIPIPPVPPPPPSLPPPLVVPVRPPSPPLPATVMLNAPGDAIAGKDSLRVTFGPDNAALNPTTDAAIRALAHGPLVAPATDFTVTAFAAAVADDPSAARRLSLSRALAVRSVLINEGVTSVHIYVKALGAPPPEDKPADRVDVTASQNGANQNAPVPKASQ